MFTLVKIWIFVARKVVPVTCLTVGLRYFYCSFSAIFSNDQFFTGIRSEMLLKFSGSKLELIFCYLPSFL